MRTFLIGLVGGILVFSFFWYRGDVGAIPLGPLGELKPPAERTLLDKLKELQQSERAIGGQLASPEASAVFERPTRVYAGQLIAKPKRAPAAAPSGAEADAPLGVAFAAAARSLADARPSADPMSVASSVGQVESGAGDTLIINLDFDVSPEEADAPVEDAAPDRAEPLSAPGSIGLRPGSAASAASSGKLEGSARMVVARAKARLTRARIIEARVDACPEGATEADYRGRPEIGVACSIAKLKKSDQFVYVEPNFIASHEMEPPRTAAVAFAAPSDPLYGLQWHYRAQGAGAGQSQGGAGFETFWAKQGKTGSPSIVVAVVDTGLDLEHPDIKGSPNIAPGVDMVSVPFYANDGDGRDLNPADPGDICDPTDPFAENSFHGTHVAGTIGAVATNNGVGVAGGAWEVKVVPVRALGRCGGLQSDINDAIRWAAGVEPTIVETEDGGTISYANPNPANIINLSLGFRAPSGCPTSTQEAIDAAVAKGAIVVAAAGNSGINVDGYGPSGCNNVITVAAGDGVGALANYSNWGDKVDVMAPGGDMRRDLDKDGHPDGVLSTKRRTNCVDPITGEKVESCIYSFENGTSMAAPHVSAALALLKSANPKTSNAELENIIVNQARAPRTPAQCTLACGAGGGTPLPDQPGQCRRPCGNGLLDLGLAAGGG